MGENHRKHSKDLNRDKNDKVIQGETLAAKMFNLIFQYRESKMFVWISNHHTFSLVMVAVWGLVILGFFLWFIFSNIIQNAPPA
jgi:hypothetical protein